MTRSIAICLLTAVATLATAQDHAGSERVVVVRNTRSAASRTIAEDYAQRRGAAIVDVTCPDAALDATSETIPHADYLTSIATPLRVWLASHPGVDYIVLTKGIPIRVQGAPRGVFHGQLALDSVLAALGYEEDATAVTVDVTDANFGPTYHGRPWANRFWNSAAPFRHATCGGYLVTRLDGYTVADALALTTRALAAAATLEAGTAPAGTVLLDVCPSAGMGDPARQPHALVTADHRPHQDVLIAGESAWGDWNADMKLADGRLRARGLASRLETSDVFQGMPGLMGYASWGSNDSHYDAGAYRALGFAPGAIAETAVSTSGRTFLPTTGGQSLLADLIAQGLSGGKGYTDEPLLQAIASPSILFDRYARGWNLADSFYAASALVGWQDIVIGDPLCRGYPERP
ncbi:MAG: hypothetical protein H0X38_00485 [Planctomycetes bacterium]|nr:hypothetical protein [Planctomycetota bacterium]